MLTSLFLVVLGQDGLPPASERVAGWAHDLDAFLGALEREHYVLRERGIPDELYAAADELRVGLERFSDQRVLVELQRIARLAGDGHTYVLPFAPRVETTGLPFTVHFFADGLFVVDAPADLARCIGGEVRALGTTPITAVVARLGEWISRDNEQGIRWMGPTFLRLTGVLEVLAAGATPALIPVTLRFGDGREETLGLVPQVLPATPGIPKLAPSRRAGAPPAPLYLENVATAHWLRPLADGTLYVQFNQVANAPGQSLAEFAALLGAALDTMRPRQLVLDVRHNNGGNSGLLQPLLDELVRFEREQPERRIVVLMGRNTFSAAQIFLARVDRETGALFAGEPSSSSPNFVGEEHAFVLPWSGGYTSISNRYHETIPGDTRAFIAPDIPFELSSADYFANRDPLLERILTE